MAKKSTPPTYPVHRALEEAVIVDAEDDAPRLVYADWLEENGDPDRATVIRTQVALWNRNPADVEYVDLLERKREILPALGRRFLTNRGGRLIFGGYPPEEERDDQTAVWHRGFPFFFQ